jgi:fimbrial chaperone protein
LLSAAALLPPTVDAAALSVSPIRVEMSDRERTAVVTLFNGGETESVVQAQAFLWQQTDGEDQLTDTRDVLVSPAVFTLPAGKSQLIRLSLRRGADPTHELAYRLILQQVPGAVEAQPSGLKVALRMSLPVFIAAAAETQPELAWQASCCTSDGLSLTVVNHGTRHVRVTDFELHDAGDAASALAAQQVAAYVLPGQSRRWLFATPAEGEAADVPTRLSLTGHTEDGPVSAEIPVSGI